MTVTRLPIDGIGIQIFAHPEGGGRWDLATWGGGTWSTETWRDATCQITSVRTQWGTARGLGVLSVAAGGAFAITTYDPDRSLDPTNPASTFGGDPHPGTRMRLVYGAEVIVYASLDTIGYSTKEQRGRLSGVDPVALLANTEVLDPLTPATLRAYARAILALTPYATELHVESDPVDGDPAIGAADAAAKGAAWNLIAAAAQDALHFAWIDPDLTLRFRSHGDPVDLGLTLGLEGIPTGELATEANADGILNQITAKGPTGSAFTVSSTESIRRFGIKPLDRGARKVPNATVWADRVLADRKAASLEYLPLQIIPTTAPQLVALINLGGVELVRIRLDVPEPDVSVDVRAVGMQLEANPDGWNAAVIGYVSALEWSGGVTPPPIEPPVIPPASQTVTRSVTSTKASRVSLTNTGAKYGSGAENELPVGAHSGWKDRGLIAFAPDFANVLEIVSAKLRLRTSTQVNTGFGSSPRTRVQRLTGSWSEGSATSPGSGNAVTWANQPPATSTGEANGTIPESEGASVDIDITAIVKAWAPVSAGGSGAINYGVRLISWDESTESRTTEFMSDDAGTSSYRPQLIMTVKIPA